MKALILNSINLLFSQITYTAYSSGVNPELRLIESC